MTGSEAWPVVVRRGDAPYENGRPFRFIGLTAPNIQAHESQVLPDFSNRLPDDYGTRDMLGSLQRLGARATGLQDSVTGNAKQLEESNDPIPITLWTDPTRPRHATTYYSIRGFNAAGGTEYSPVLAVTEP